MSKNYIPISIINNSTVPTTSDTEVYDEVILEGLQNVQQLVFKDLNSYHRLFVHRLAVNYKFSHPSDYGSKTVVLYKNIESSVPKLKFCDIKGPDESEIESPLTKGMMIMKRSSDTKKPFKPKLATKQTSVEDKKSGLSLEEREEAYRLARARIFNNANTSGTDSSPNQGGFEFERDTDSEASLQFRDDLMEDKESGLRTKIFNQTREDTNSTQYTPSSRV
ncbi:hypothetical protein CONCODRAFT_10805, partial [Conidiobolus coronatus NRRL 28638]